MGLSIHETTLSRHADGRQDVVTGHHYCPNVGVKELLNDSRSCRLELVLKNNEANKVKVAFDFTSGHFLSLDPTELLEVTASNTNYTITLVSVPRQKLVIILGDYGVATYLFHCLRRTLDKDVTALLAELSDNYTGASQIRNEFECLLYTEFDAGLFYVSDCLAIRSKRVASGHGVQRGTVGILSVLPCGFGKQHLGFSHNLAESVRVAVNDSNTKNVQSFFR
ncbi:hypothetical protein HG530_007322 [Fusarium avenaceum]|nr:hypothetical protein HG530_007322 [Fusarium avenaceum]